MRMIFNDIWWYLMIFEYIWWYLNIFDDIWWYLNISESMNILYWIYLMIFECIWLILMIFVLILKFDDISWYFNGFQMVSTCFNYLPWFSFIFHYFSVFGPPHYPTRTLVARKEGKEKQWRERQNWIGEPPWCRLWGLDGTEWFRNV